MITMIKEPFVSTPGSKVEVIGGKYAGFCGVVSQCCSDTSSYVMISGNVSVRESSVDDTDLIIAGVHKNKRCLRVTSTTGGCISVRLENVETRLYHEQLRNLTGQDRRTKRVPKVSEDRRTTTWDRQPSEMPEVNDSTKVAWNLRKIIRAMLLDGIVAKETLLEMALAIMEELT